MKLSKYILIFGICIFTLMAYQNCGDIQVAKMALENSTDFNSDDPNNPDDSSPVNPNPPAEQVNCNDPLIKPNGFTQSSLGWKEWGNSHSYPPEFGATKEVAFRKNEYVVLDFIPQAGSSLSISTASNQTLGVSWSGMYISVSECPGDFRAPVNTSPYITMRSVCRKYISGGEGTVPIFNTSQSSSACSLVPGKKYYINMIFSNPTVLNYGMGESSCKDPSGYCGPQYAWGF